MTKITNDKSKKLMKKEEKPMDTQVLVQSINIRDQMYELQNINTIDKIEVKMNLKKYKNHLNNVMMDIRLMITMEGHFLYF